MSRALIDVHHDLAVLPQLHNLSRRQRPVRVVDELPVCHCGATAVQSGLCRDCAPQGVTR